MKFYLSFFDNKHNKPNFKFIMNLFFIKLTQYSSIKQLTHIQIFLNVQRIFKIKIFKINYALYTNALLLFFLFNMVVQVTIMFAYIC